MHTKSASEYRHLCCFAPSISVPGGVDAAHHKVQHDRPPLPGLPLSACKKPNVLAYPFAAVSGSESGRRVA